MFKVGTAVIRTEQRPASQISAAPGLPLGARPCVAQDEFVKGAWLLNVPAQQRRDIAKQSPTWGS